MWCNKEAKKKKKKKEGKNEIYFSHLSRGERTAFYLKRLFFYSRTYTSTTKGWFLDDTARRITCCTVLIHTYHERRMPLLLYIYVHTCARYVYTHCT